MFPRHFKENIFRYPLEFVAMLSVMQLVGKRADELQRVANRNLQRSAQCSQRPSIMLPIINSVVKLMIKTRSKPMSDDP